MSFRKTNRIDKADHTVVPNPDDTTSDSLKEQTWDEVLKQRIAAELESRKDAPKED